jgi:hypothetical protein
LRQHESIVLRCRRTTPGKLVQRRARQRQSGTVEKLGISSPFEEVPLSGGRWAVNISSYRLWQTGLLLFVLTNLGLLVTLAISIKV